jgi:putative methyltransferase (TIGR04325 family)
MLRSILKDWLPPLIVRSILNSYSKNKNFEGDFKTWEDASALCTGYDTQIIIEKVLDAAMKVKNGEAVFERDSVIFEEVQYSWSVTAALLWAAARNNGELHVLDFGGALGSSYFQNRKFTSDLENVSWSVVEQRHFVESGRKFVQDDVLKFYYSIQEALSVNSPNVILLSSVAQYIPNLKLLFEQINEIKSCILVIDRTPFSSYQDNKLCIQHVSEEIYKASYPMWVLSSNNLINQLSQWRVVEKFCSPEGHIQSSAGLEFSFSGYIFERIHD